MSRRNKEINVFSTSAIDLFASSLGVFIVLVIILFPYFRNQSKKETQSTTVEITQLQEQVKSLQQTVESQEKIVKELEEAKKVIEQAKITEVELQKTIEELKVESQDVVKKDVVKELERKIKELEKEKKIVKEDNTEDLIKQIKQIEKEKKELKERIVTLEKTPKETKNVNEIERELKKVKEQNEQLKKQVKTVTQTEDQVEKVKEEVKKLQQQVQQEKQEKDELQKENKKLQAESNKMNKQSSFAAIIIKWSTQKHDVDLEVVDPKGKTYNYKQRKAAGSSATFALDSRFGPGAEVWQTSDLVPGTYKIHYKFYNDYGNKEPAKIETNIFSIKGNFSLPGLSLTTDGKNEATKTFKIDRDGNVIL